MKKILGFYGILGGIVLTALLLVFVPRLMLSEPTQTQSLFTGKYHMVLLIPDDNFITEPVAEAAEYMADFYGIDVELYPFSTVSDQEAMLQALPYMDIDGVLLWPNTSDTAVYRSSLEALKTHGIPTVTIDRDVDIELRNSFICSGTRSIILVLKQSVQKLNAVSSIALACSSGSGAEQTAEILLCKQTETADFDIESIRDVRLRQLAVELPGNFRPVKYTVYRGTDAQALRLREELEKMFRNSQAPSLLFSLDPNFSSVAVAAYRNAYTGRTSLICRGELTDLGNDLQNGIVDALIISEPKKAATTGIHYLIDICRGLWVPDTIDAGVSYLSADDLIRSIAPEE